MDQEAHEIEAHIDRTRERLGSHLRELEDKVEAAVDWREHFRDRPYVFLGAAVVGGAVLAAMLRSRPSRWNADEHDSTPRAYGRGVAQSQALELWDNITAALVGVATARIKDYISDLLPGFDEHYRRAEQRTSGAPPAAGSYR
jgi:hypothetical protein